MATMTEVMGKDSPGSGSATENGRDRILRVAAELFLKHGYAEASLRTIADEVGMRPASIYHHFESKDALLAEILDIGIKAIGSALDLAAGAVPETASPRERLEAYIAAHLEALFANQAFTAAHVTVFPLVPDGVRKIAVPGRDEYEAKWTNLLEDLVPDLPAKALAYNRLSLIGAMNSSLHWFDQDSASLDDLAAALSETFWNGIEGRK